MLEDVTDKFSIKQMNDYATSKWVNELQIMNAQATHGTERVRLTPAGQGKDNDCFSVVTTSI
jgi:hypothetical protein